MWYAKNLPRWERTARLAAAAVMGTCAVHYGLNPVGVVFGIVGAVTALTALLGYCPMCAMGGRRGPGARGEP